MKRWSTILIVMTAMIASACGTRVPVDQALRVGGSGDASTIDSSGGAVSSDAGGSVASTDPAASTGSGPGAGTATAKSGVAPSKATGSGSGGGTATPAPGAVAPVAGAKPTTNDGPSDEGVTDTEIRIGSSGPLSGVAGFLGDEAFGAIDSYFQSVNAKGGVNGRKLRLVTYDDRLDASQTLANVRKLYEQDKVLGLMLAFGDPVADYVTRNNIPTVVFGVTPLSFSSKFPTVYPLVGNALLWTQEAITGIKAQGLFKPGMKVGMIYDTQIFDVTPYVPYLKEAWEDAGAKVVVADPFNLTDGDCTSLVLKMKDAGVDWWDFQGLGWVLCASAAQRQQYRPTIGWGSWATSVGGLATQVGPWVDGMWGGSNGDQPDGAPRQKTAAHDEYVGAIKRYHPNISAPVHLDSPATIGYWSGAKLIASAIAAQGKSVTKAGVNDWIAKVENFDVGITPPIVSMAPNCKTGSELVWLGQWKWDSAKKEAYRKPQSGYLTSEQKDKYGGKCFLTKLSDSMG